MAIWYRITTRMPQEEALRQLVAQYGGQPPPGVTGISTTSDGDLTVLVFEFNDRVDVAQLAAALDAVHVEEIAQPPEKVPLGGGFVMTALDGVSQP